MTETDTPTTAERLERSIERVLRRLLDPAMQRLQDQIQALQVYTAECAAEREQERAERDEQDIARQIREAEKRGFDSAIQRVQGEARRRGPIGPDTIAEAGHAGPTPAMVVASAIAATLESARTHLRVHHLLLLVAMLVGGPPVVDRILDRVLGEEETAPPPALEPRREPAAHREDPP